MRNLEDISPRIKAEFLDKYPLLFPNGKLPYCGFYCGVGWFPILQKLCSDITKILETLPKEDRTAPVAQVKEKFGSLRWYQDNIHENVSDEVYALISKAEKASSSVCEDCGEPGITTGSGWLRTLCENCSK